MSLKSSIVLILSTVAVTAGGVYWYMQNTGGTVGESARNSGIKSKSFCSTDMPISEPISSDLNVCGFGYDELRGILFKEVVLSETFHNETLVRNFDYAKNNSVEMDYRFNIIHSTANSVLFFISDLDGNDGPYLLDIESGMVSNPNCGNYFAPEPVRLNPEGDRILFDGEIYDSTMICGFDLRSSGGFSYRHKWPSDWASTEKVEWEGDKIAWSYLTNSGDQMHIFYSIDDDLSVTMDEPERLKTSEEIMVDLVGQSFGGSWMKFTAFSDFYCLKIYDEKQVANGTLVEFDVRAAMKWRNGHLADMSVTYKKNGDNLDYLSHSVEYDFASAGPDSCATRSRR